MIVTLPRSESLEIVRPSRSRILNEARRWSAEESNVSFSPVDAGAVCGADRRLA
jgi:hypothetical protein